MKNGSITYKPRFPKQIVKSASSNSQNNKITKGIFITKQETKNRVET